MRLLLPAGLLSLLFSVTGCSINSGISTPKINKKNVSTAITALDLKVLQSLDTITPKLAKHRTVFVGEQHDQYADHLNQLAVIKSVFKHWGKNTRIGLEMIQQPYQPYLDKYIAGKISEREMLRGVEWYERWRFDFRLYRPIFDYAKANKIPLIALNIPKELTQKITKVGISGLSTAERQQLPPVIDRSNTKYIKRITNVFGKHSHTSSKGIQKFIDAQLAWDEGMAFSAAKYLKKYPRTRMVILAGGGHVINRDGIPNRLDRKINSPSAIVLNNIRNTPSTDNGDYLLFSPEINLPPAGKLGVIMDQGKQGVMVKALSPNGAALIAGIQKGDIITSINEEPIKVVSDLMLWGLDKKSGDTARLKILRNSRVVLKTVRLKSAIPHL